MQHKSINIKLLESNTGQIKGLPKNPRFIRDEKYRKLVQSIKDDPELLTAMPLVVIPKGRKFVTLAGNMRLRACGELQWQEVPCVIVSPKTSLEKLKAYVLKTNIAYGEHDWDLLANEWSDEPLTDWGMNLPKDWLSDELGDTAPQLSDMEYRIIVQCESEGEQARLLERFESEGIKCQALIS